MRIDESKPSSSLWVRSYIESTMDSFRVIGTYSSRHALPLEMPLLLSLGDGDGYTRLDIAPHRRAFVRSRRVDFTTEHLPAFHARRSCGEQWHVRPRIGVDARVVLEAHVHWSTTTSKGPFLDRKDRRSFADPRTLVPDLVNSRLPFFSQASRVGFDRTASRLTLG